MDLISRLDDILEERILLFGSLPPEARDLDLLVPEPEIDRVEGFLASQDFERLGAQWARFRGRKVDAVDVVPASSWALSPEAVARLYGDAKPLPARRMVCRPAPRHVLLILALRLARGASKIAVEKRGRIERALEEDPDAWEAARSEAVDWGLRQALQVLRTSYAGAKPPSRRARAAAVRDRTTGSRSSFRAAVSAATAIAPRKGPRRVITLSGLDGAGKSTQAEWLGAGLEVLGIDAGVEWTRLAQDPILDAIALPVKRFLRREGKDRRTQGVERNSARSMGSKRGPLLTYLWTIVVALANAGAHRREVARQARHGKVAICDRYVLDSIVHLRRKYGAERKFRLQAAIIRGLSPRPTRSYYLEVPPEIAHARKEDVYKLDQLKIHAGLYREVLPRLAVVEVNGQQSPEEICEFLLRDAWLTLNRSTARSEPGR